MPSRNRSIPEILRRRALEHEDEADRDRSAHERSHHQPYANLVPSLVDQAQQEESQRPFGQGHADDGKALPEGLPHNGAGKVFQRDIPHVLPEAVVRGYGATDCVAQE